MPKKLSARRFLDGALEEGVIRVSVDAKIARREIEAMSPKLHHFVKESSVAYEESPLGPGPVVFSLDDHLH